MNHFLPFLTVVVATQLAQVVSYEGVVFPENAIPPWTRIGTYDVDRWLDSRHLWQAPELGIWYPPPNGEQDYYRRDMSEFAGVARFFIQWRVESTMPGEICDMHVVSTVLTANGNGPTYHTTICRDRIRFLRDTDKFLFINIEPGVMHTYYIELHGPDSFAFFIDGELSDAGIPIAPFPNAQARMTWGTAHYLYEQVVHWDYIRYGVIPTDFSGDYDSDGDVDATDLYFFVDCLLGPAYDAAGPGCRWADMNADGVANGSDIAEFTGRMLR